MNAKNIKERLLMSQKGVTIWFTGLPCAGKTTISKGVEEKLKSRGVQVERLDGDTVREGLSKELGFSAEDRDQNIERVTFVAKLLTRNNIAVLSALIAPYKRHREHARKEIGNFVEVFVNTPIAVCEKRDIKGLYTEARAGNIQNFTGISDPYEEPENPEIEVKTADSSVEESVDFVLQRLEELGWVQPESDYSAEDEQKVADRLKSLGYL